MARKSSPTISQEELYPSDDQDFAREEMDDARLLDLEVEQESPFLRGQKRVSVRRGSIPKKTATRLKWTAIAAILIFFGALGVGALYKYGEHSWRFRIDSSDNIDITGTHNVTHAQVMEVLGGDIGRNIFFIPLSQRKAQLEQIPWVESASIMRFVPNRLKVEISERTPVAFARIGPRISADRCRWHAHGAAVGRQEEIFVPRDPWNERQRTAFHSRRTDENLQPVDSRSGCGRRALFPGP